MGRWDDISNSVIAGVIVAAVIAAGGALFGVLHDGGGDEPTVSPTASAPSLAPPSPASPTSPAPPPAYTPSPAPSDEPGTTTDAAPVDVTREERAPDTTVDVAAADGELTVVRIEPGKGGRTGVDEYRAGATPGFGISVYTQNGKVGYSEECFVDWTYRADGEIVSTADSRCASGGITPFSSGPLVAGSGVVTANVTTGWGKSGSAEYHFSVTG